MKKYFAFIFAFFILPFSVAAAEKFTVELKMKNGELIPRILTVPTKKIIRIKISNIGDQSAEFESLQLRKEKVLAPSAKSVVVIAPLREGSYTFFDDFHLDLPKGQIIAKDGID